MVFDFIIRLYKSGLSWGLLATTCKVAGILVVLPIALANLDQEAMGLWFLFLGFGAFASRLDFGMSATVSRNFAFLCAKREQDAKGGVSRGADDINGFIKSMLRVYAVLVGSLFIIIILITLYSYSRLTYFGSAGLVSWGLYGASIVFQLYGSLFVALTMGAGLVRKNQQVVAVAAAVGPAIAIFGLWKSGGLVALALGSLATSMLTAVGNILLVRSHIAGAVVSVHTEIDVKYWVVRMWPAIWRTGLISIGAYLAYYANTAWTAKHVSLSEAASYGLAFQCIQLAMVIAALPLTLSVPAISWKWAQGKYESAWKIFIVKHLSTLAIFIFIVSILLVFGEMILLATGSKTPLLSGGQMMLMCFIYLLEVNHSGFATFLMATDRLPFVWASICSGLLIAIIGNFSAKAYGVYGLLFTVFIVQAAWNNWWIPGYAINSLRALSSAEMRNC